MHAIQTSGNCIRNVTADHFAGAAADEVADPRPYAEIIRQWSTLHPEFSFLPRKFKVAVIGAPSTIARPCSVHDIGLHLKRLADGGLGFAVWVGGGQGRTPIIAKKIRDDLPEADLLSYLEAILRVYNLHGRRDNNYKARIKILVHEIGAEAFAREVEEEWQRIRDGALKLPARGDRPHRGLLRAAGLRDAAARRPGERSRAARPRLRPLGRRATRTPTSSPATSIVTISLKPIGGIPGDATADADGRRRRPRRALLASTRCASRTSRTWCCRTCSSPTCAAVYDALKRARAGRGQRRARHRHHRLPGPRLLRARQCALDPDRAAHLRAASRPRARTTIGELKIKISGCINACGHHHVGHIGILGVEKRGEEHYQLLLGGSGAEDATLASITGPGFGPDGIVDAVEKVVDTYLELRSGPDEPFLAAYGRLGPAPSRRRSMRVSPSPARRGCLSPYTGRGSG